jgi:hypothetical protein
MRNTAHAGAAAVVANTIGSDLDDHRLREFEPLVG